jgi:2-polyprenyl-3-methyl-5-hydroxy-6-metoxy-1,4-benzoquinol methylase
MPNNNILNTNLANQSYWDDSYALYQLNETVADDDIIKKWILKYVPKTNNGECFEIGCFPGRYLTVMGDLGYTLNGIDLTPRVNSDFPEWLKSKGYKIGSFIKDDFLKLKSEKKYDLVCSFGFIEHFTNWDEIFEKHIELVNEEGYIVIETPNFRGFFQRLIHYVLDYENYKRHYVPSMNPKKWKKLCEKHGFTTIYSGYIGEFQFWIDKQPTTYIKTKLFNRLITNYERMKKWKPNNPHYSPYCGIIAKRIKKS